MNSVPRPDEPNFSQFFGCPISTFHQGIPRVLVALSMVMYLVKITGFSVTPNFIVPVSLVRDVSVDRTCLQQALSPPRLINSAFVHSVVCLS